MTPLLELYLQALDRVRAVVAAVPPDRWDVATPCPDWSARQLLGHLIEGQHQVMAMATGAGPRPPVTDPEALGSMVGGSPFTTWLEVHQHAARVLAGLAPDAPVATPLGLQTVAQLLGIALIEPVVHAWDLAAGTGQVTDFDLDAVEALLPGVMTLGGQLQATGMYGAPISPPADAPPQDRLLAALGRDPHESEARTDRAEALRTADRLQ